MSILRLLGTAALLTILVVGCTGLLRAQSRVTVQLSQPPANQLKIADLWRIRLVNNTSTTFTICLTGTIDETALGLRLVDATTARFTLPPGTKIVTGADIQPIDATYHNEKYKNAFLRTGQAPTGEYRICVEVRDECGAEILATDCKSAVIQQLNPPILISPPDESTVEEPLPAFSWLPPSPLRLGQRVAYRLKMVEVLGRQSAYDAMRSNPAWFERQSLGATVVQYPISSRKLRSGGRYAWMIVASDGDFPMGESEIWTFAYKPRTLTDFPRDDDDTGNEGGGRRDTVVIRSAGGELVDFKPRPGAITTFTDAIGRQRGITLINRELLIDDPIRVSIDIVRDRLKPSIPPALLKELLRSCSGE